MKAAVHYGNRDIRVEDVPVPKIQAGEVLIRVKACGICGSDLHEYKLCQFPGLGVPAGEGKIMGHEFSGEVAELGKGVEGLKIGDRVVAVAYGGNAEFVKIGAMARPLILPITPSLSFAEAATTEPLATSLHGVNLANPQDGQTIVVLGMGLIGLGTLQILKAISKAKVFVVDVSEKRLEIAKKIGADVVIDARKVDPYEYMLKTNGNTKIEYLEFPHSEVDTIIDCAGFSQESQGEPPLMGGLKMLKPNGKFVEVAVLEKMPELNLNIIMRKNIFFIGSWAWTPFEFVTALEMLKSSAVQRKPLISHTFPLEQAPQAYEMQMNTKEAIKVILTG